MVLHGGMENGKLHTAASLLQTSEKVHNDIVETCFLPPGAHAFLNVCTFFSYISDIVLFISHTFIYLKRELVACVQMIHPEAF